VRDLHAPINAANDQALFAPVELKRLAQPEGQWHERILHATLARLLAPDPHEIGHARVATRITRRPDLGVQSSHRATPVARPMAVGRERLCQRFMKLSELDRAGLPHIQRRDIGRCLDPLLHRVACQPGASCDVA